MALGEPLLASSFQQENLKKQCLSLTLSFRISLIDPAMAMVVVFVADPLHPRFFLVLSIHSVIDALQSLPTILLARVLEVMLRC